MQEQINYITSIRKCWYISLQMPATLKFTINESFNHKNKYKWISCPWINHKWGINKAFGLIKILFCQDGNLCHFCFSTHEACPNFPDQHGNLLWCKYIKVLKSPIKTYLPNVGHKTWDFDPTNDRKAKDQNIHVQDKYSGCDRIPALKTGKIEY